MISVWTYPWDLLDEGLDSAVERIAELGIEAVRMASAYHSGKFISPRSPHRRVVFPEGGVLYFRPRGRHFHGLTIQPTLSTLMEGADPLASLVDSCRRHGLKAVAWLVGTHNTRLALAHPECQVQNAFGDGYLYCLCPAQSVVQDYLRAVVSEVVEGYAIDAVEIESPGYLGFVHGYHHEFYSVELGLLEQSLLALCFCPACERLGLEAGIAMASLRRRVARSIDERLNRAATPKRTLEQQIVETQEFFRSDTELWGFIERRLETVTALIRDISQITRGQDRELFCDGPIFLRPASLAWLEGLDPERLSEFIEQWDVPLYFDRPERRSAEAHATASLGLRCRTGAVLNVGHTFTHDREDLLDAVRAVQESGLRALGFYNYGTLPEHRLEWLQAAVKLWRSKGI